MPARSEEAKATKREYDRRYAAENRAKIAEKTARWKAANYERKCEANRAWRKRNPDKVREQNRSWWANNKERSREYARRRVSTPRGKLENVVRCGIYSRLSRAAGRKGSAKTFDLIGYSVEALVEHIERQFTKGMSWDNYGEWHVDHIVPIASFTYETFSDPEFRAAWALTNLRPMWGKENYAKGARRLTLL